MRFTKMHGAGNDYVYINGFDETLPDDLPELARQISDRHFGVGGDGMVLILPSTVADARMRMFNADGSEAEMCGNAIRCVGKFLFDHALTAERELRIETGAGILTVQLEVAHGVVERVRVDMGLPRLVPAEIPTTLPASRLTAAAISRLPAALAQSVASAVVDAPLDVAGERLAVSCVSMGNPHCVTFVDRLSDRWVREIGPRIEVDEHFPRKVNAEFVEVISPTELRMRVWERGSGETLACGTGAAAVCVAGVLSGRTRSRVVIHLLGGDLELEWGADGHVYKTGPAVEVFAGEWQLDPARAAAPIST
ncbi:MAG: diaminopimelate epimerase [Planctomycetaceae bacterium]|nr:diaminopimelate epimerase [Planctomycetaceae bacterium]